MAHVSICLVGYRNLTDVAACIESLAVSTYADFEIIICENGGGDAHAMLATLMPASLAGGQPIRILPPTGNLGYAGGNNRCVAARPDSDLWWILNPDTRVGPDAMKLLVAHLTRSAADAVGGTLLRPDGRVQAYGGRWTTLFARAESIGQGEAYDPSIDAMTHEIDYILGASLMFTRRFLEVAGPMREDYFLYGEEVEWCLRARALGLRLGVEPRAVVTHAQGTTTGDNAAFAAKPWLPVYLDQRNKLLILRDVAPGLAIPGAAGSLLMLLGRATKNRAWRQLGFGISGWLAGVRGERGIPPRLNG